MPPDCLSRRRSRGLKVIELGRSPEPARRILLLANSYQREEQHLPDPWRSDFQKPVPLNAQESDGLVAQESGPPLRPGRVLLVLRLKSMHGGPREHNRCLQVGFEFHSLIERSSLSFLQKE